MSIETPAQDRKHRTVVYEAIGELQDSEQPVTRDSIVKLTGISRGIVDEQTKTLKEMDLIYSPTRGMYRQMHAHAPARPISRTILRNGVNKIEIGDKCLDLTPAEARILGSLFGGSSAEAAVIEAGQSLSEMCAQLSNVVAKTAKELKK